MSSFQNHLVKVIEFIESLEVELIMLSSMSFHKKIFFFTNSFVKNVLKLTLNLWGSGVLSTTGWLFCKLFVCVRTAQLFSLSYLLNFKIVFQKNMNVLQLIFFVKLPEANLLFYDLFAVVSTVSDCFWGKNSPCYCAVLLAFVFIKIANIWLKSAIAFTATFKKVRKDWSSAMKLLLIFIWLLSK